MRAFGKLSNPKAAALMESYNLTVFKVNSRYVDTGMEILSEIVSLLIIAGAAFFAISTKLDNTPDNIAIIGTSIAFSMKITGMFTGILWSISSLDGLVYDNVARAYGVIDKNQ